MHAVSGAKDSSLSAAAAYDAIAANYDDQVRGDEWMRRALHAHYRQVFRAGDRVLDVGCGTGIDAIALSKMGIRVVGIDGSPAMIAELLTKAQEAAVETLIEAHVADIEKLGRFGDEDFDGLISAFASLSSLSDLARFADDAARLVRPGGRLVLHLLNRFSLWEWLGYVARRDVASARRVGQSRVRVFVIGGQPVKHSMYFADEAYQRFFTAGFAKRAAYCLGTLRPPHTVRRLPAPLVSGLERLDVRLGGWPLVRNAGRFFVLDLERRA